VTDTVVREEIEVNPVNTGDAPRKLPDQGWIRPVRMA
jgi:hypothetical protein